MRRSMLADVSRSARVAALVGACLGLGVVGMPALADDRAADAEPVVAFLKVGELAPTHQIIHAPDWAFGGISAIEWLDWPVEELPNFDDGMMLFLSDDGGDHGAPRIGFGHVRLRDAQADEPSQYPMPLVKWRALPTPQGKRFEEDTTDPEGIRVLESREDKLPVIVWTSEGYVRGGVDPAIYIWDMTEDKSRALDVPEAFIPQRNDAGEIIHGITHNHGFEAITILPDGSFIVAPEHPPVQDVREGMPRLLRVQRYFDLKPADTLWYPMLPTVPGGSDRWHGVTEMLALDDKRLLVLERSLDADRVQHAWLVEADLTTPRGMPLRTRVLFDFRTVEDQLPGGVVPNLEGMTLGPVGGVPGHPDRRALIVVSDNNFEEDVPTVWITLDLGD